VTFSADDLDESNARQIEKATSKPDGRDVFLPQFGYPLTDWWRWFAWYPIKTVDRGWVWLRLLHRRRIAKYPNLPGGADFWFQNAVNSKGPTDA
jgi:hypothetical protein